MIYFCETPTQFSVYSPTTGESLVISREVFADYDMITQYCKTEDADFEFIKFLTRGRNFDISFTLPEVNDDVQFVENESGEIVFKSANYALMKKVPPYIIDVLKSRRNDFHFKKVLYYIAHFMRYYSCQSSEDRNKIDNHFMKNDWILSPYGHIVVAMSQENKYGEILPEFSEEPIYLRTLYIDSDLLSTYHPKFLNTNQASNISFDAKALAEALQGSGIERSEAITASFGKNAEKVKDLSDVEIVRLFIESA